MFDESALARSFRALSHPHRARIYRCLAETPQRTLPLAVLVERAGLSTIALRHHLHRMKRYGLLSVVQDEAGTSYKLTPDRFLCDTNAVRALAIQGALPDDRPLTEMSDRAWESFLGEEDIGLKLAHSR